MTSRSSASYVTASRVRKERRVVEPQLVDVGHVHERPAGKLDRALHGRVAVAGREAHYRLAGLDEHLHRSNEPRGRPVRDEDVVATRHAAEMLEPELGEPLAVERRGELVVERCALRQRERANQAREVEERPFRVPAGHDPPGDAQLRDVVGGRAEDLPALVRQLCGDVGAHAGGAVTRLSARPTSSRLSRYAASRVSGNEMTKKAIMIAP